MKKILERTSDTLALEMSSERQQRACSMALLEAKPSPSVILSPRIRRNTTKV